MQVKRDEEELSPDINVTPLVDICLVLVIIFMITTPIWIESNILVNVPRPLPQTAKVRLESEKLTLEIKAENEITKFVLIEERLKEGKSSEEASFENLQTLMAEKIARLSKKIVYIKAERNVKHGDVVKALDITKISGAERLTIIPTF